MSDALSQTQGEDSARELYVERNLTPHDFVRWVKGEQTAPLTRLRSIVGPPGSGKTTFLNDFRETLQGKAELNVLFLNARTVSARDPSDKLHDWLMDLAAFLEIPFVSDRTVAPAASFTAFLSRMDQKPAVLLVDGLDEAQPTAQPYIENLIAIFLFSHENSAGQRFAVITYRDHHKLQEASLRWEEDIYPLSRVTLDDFQSWIAGRPAKSALATRLRSIIGPPGSGKSTFLRLLAVRLGEADTIVLWLDVAELGPLPDALIDWLNYQAREFRIKSVVDRADATFSASFAAFLRQLPSQPVVLLVDSFEDIAQEWREVLETQVFWPFLFPPGAEADNRYAVIARRDEYGLQEALLRWEDDVYTLKGIDAVVHDGSVEQIRRRLEAVAAAGPEQAGAILEWEEGDGELPTDSVTHIRGLDDAGRDILVSDLAASLTENPYINLALLRRKLLHPDRPLDQADYRTCLEAYVRRAGLIEDKEAVIEMLADIGKRAAADGSGRMSDYRIEPTRRFEDVMAAGIVTHVPGRPHYTVDPAVLKLLRQAARIPAAATTDR